jgi:hypothetical protein
MEPFVQLRRRVDETLSKHGLVVTDMLFSVDDPMEIHIRTRIVTPPTTDEFEEVIASAHAAEVEQRAEEARKALQQEIDQWFEP